MKYNTKNRLIIINCLKENKDRHLTIEEIYHLLDEAVPLASLYRIIDDLVEQGIIRKFNISSDLPSCYQYMEDGEEHLHFHLLCTECGKLIHLECDEVNHLLKHIQEEHKFSIDISKINLYGLCEECQRKALK